MSIRAGAAFCSSSSSSSEGQWDIWRVWRFNSNFNSISICLSKRISRVGVGALYLYHTIWIGLGLDSMHIPVVQYIYTYLVHASSCSYRDS
jgi:hypothetical protein